MEFFFRKIRRLIRGFGLPGALAAGLTFLLYILLFDRRVLLDITGQVHTLLRVCAGEVALPPTALFYLSTWALAFGQCDFRLLMGAAVVALSLFALAKFWVSRRIWEDFYRQQPEALKAGGWVALGLGWVCSLPTPDWWRHGWYIIGQPSPNYWMNGTLLASFPFALALFWQSYRQLAAPVPGWWRRQLLWIVLLAFSKPSYLFVYGLTYPVFQAFQPQASLRSWLSQCWPVLLCGFLILLEYYLVFVNPQSVYVKIYNEGRASGAVVRPFAVWRLHASNVPVSVVAGVLFPLAVAVSYGRTLLKNLLFRYAWAGFGAALLVSSLFMQTGEEYYAWNFRFQHYIAAYILFLVSAIFLWEKMRVRKPRFKDWVCAALLGLHLLSGVVYLVKMWYTKSHY